MLSPQITSTIFAYSDHKDRKRLQRIAELHASGLGLEMIANRFDMSQDALRAAIESPSFPRVDVPRPERTIYDTEAARIIRKALKESFPGVKFGVRCEKYSMGSSIYVSWTDGPSESDARAVLDWFRGQEGTRMDDSPIRRVHALDGEPISWGSYVFMSRDHSDKFKALTKAAMAKLTDEQRQAWNKQVAGCHYAERPWCLVSRCDRQESATLARITRLDYLAEPKE
jgi:hypothetical protein